MIRKAPYRIISLFIKILTPATFCFFWNYISDGYNDLEILFLPLPFSILIVLPNISKKRRNFFLILFLSIILSAVTLYASILIFFALGHTVEQMLNSNNIKDGLSEFILKLVGMVSYYIIPPAMIFFWYDKLFYIVKNKFTKSVFFFSFLVFVLAYFTTYNNFSTAIAIWQFIMALALQLILYQEEVKDLFRKKSPTKS